jgi:predicted regulator of Ras-like GTPase activity (Roadblock/LC7/MglB family)
MEAEHWLEMRLAALERLSRRLGELTEERAGMPRAEAEPERVALVREFEAAVAEIAARDGITAAAASHEGLLLAKSGIIPDFEAMAAVAQIVVDAVRAGAKAMSLGTPRQVVVVGDQHKLVLFSIGRMEVAILSPRATVLAEALAS